jgi:hypothetical protein
VHARRDAFKRKDGIPANQEGSARLASHANLKYPPRSKTSDSSSLIRHLVSKSSACVVLELKYVSGHV